MSSISTWILSIVGVVVMSVVIDMVLPSGQTSGYIKGIFSFFILLVIIVPIVNMFKNNSVSDFEDIFNSDEIALQSEFLYQINEDKMIALKETIEKSIDDIGIHYVEVSLNVDIFASEFEVKNIYVNLENVVIDENVEHIDIEKAVLNIIQNCISIDEENVIFSE